MKVGTPLRSTTGFFAVWILLTVGGALLYMYLPYSFKYKPGFFSSMFWYGSAIVLFLGWFIVPLVSSQRADGSSDLKEFFYLFGISTVIGLIMGFLVIISAFSHMNPGF